MLAQTAHRPWPMPSGPWVIAQSWHDLLFAHWPVSPADLRARVPACLELDTFDGECWIGVVPFRMSGVRPRGLPALPWLSRFPELNVRTYVRGAAGGEDAKPGVFFFSLDAANPVAVAIARAVFHLPYFRADMECTRQGEEAVRYVSRRTHGGAPAGEWVARYGPTGAAGAARPGTLEHWLTERYCLYAVAPFDSGSVDGPHRAYRSEIHHAPWPLQPAFLDVTRNDVARSMGLPVSGPPSHLHFARRLDVVVWPPHRVA